jgi:hypothetical protein
MYTQFEELKQWSEKTAIKLDIFYSIEFFADDIRLYCKFDNEITRKLFNLEFECYLMSTGSIKLSKNNIIIYLS